MNLTLHHILREGNVCADILAKFGINFLDTLVMFHEPPSCHSSALLGDILGM